MAICRTCEATTTWATTENGRGMMVQPEPDGNVVIREGVAHVLKADEQARPGERRYVAHFARCPGADQHRRPRKG